MNNVEIRKELLKKRWSLSLSEKRRMDHEIYKKVIKEINFLNKEKYIGCYWPIENEVDTLGVIDYLLKNKFMVCLPSINKNEMEFKPIKSLGFEYETWKCLRQPKTGQWINKGDIQTLLVPLIGYTEEMHRLGYGNNFYNNYLNKSLTIKTIGLAYDFQKVKEIFVSEKDIKLDKIISN